MKVKILSGSRLPRPTTLDLLEPGPLLYTEVMLACWAGEARLRPGWAELAATLLELRLDGCRAITDQGVERPLAGCLALQILLLHQCPGVTERAREQLEQHLARAGRAVKQLSWTVY